MTTRVARYNLITIFGPKTTGKDLTPIIKSPLMSRTSMMGPTPMAIKNSRPNMYKMGMFTPPAVYAPINTDKSRAVVIVNCFARNLFLSLTGSVEYNMPRIMNATWRPNTSRLMK